MKRSLLQLSREVRLSDLESCSYWELRGMVIGLGLAMPSKKTKTNLMRQSVPYTGEEDESIGQSPG